MYDENILKEAFKDDTRPKMLRIKRIIIGCVFLILYLFLSAATSSKQSVAPLSDKWEVYEISTPHLEISGITTESAITYAAFSPTINVGTYGNVFMNNDGYIIVDSKNIDGKCKQAVLIHTTGQINGVKVKISSFCPANSTIYTISPQTQQGKDFLKHQLIEHNKVVIKVTQNSIPFTFTVKGFAAAVKKAKQKTQQSIQELEDRQQGAI